MRETSTAGVGLVDHRWWRLPVLVRSFLVVGLAVLGAPLLVGWALGGGYAWLAAAIAVGGWTAFFVTEQRHRASRPGTG